MTATNLFFTAQQLQALARIKDWLDKGHEFQQVFRLFGYAGTGKSTLACQAAAMVNDNIVYAAPRARPRR
jgi:exodeoxyribonuclease-5